MFDARNRSRSNDQQRKTYTTSGPDRFSMTRSHKRPNNFFPRAGLHLNHTTSTMKKRTTMKTLITVLISAASLTILFGSPNPQTAVPDRTLTFAERRVPLAPNSNVQEAWVDRYDGPGNYDDEATAVAVDGSGNVYVTGFSFDADTDYDYTTIKYNSAGQRQWIARYDGTGSYIDKATAIAVDGSGNVYVTGASTSGNGGLDYATIRYNSAGQQQWVAYYDGPGESR